MRWPWSSSGSSRMGDEPVETPATPLPSPVFQAPYDQQRSSSDLVLGELSKQVSGDCKEALRSGTFVVPKEVNSSPVLGPAEPPSGGALPPDITAAWAMSRRSRRGSEDFSVGDRRETISEAMGGMRRLKSLPGNLNASRHADVQVEPKARAELHRLHEEMKLASSGSLGIGIEDDELDAAWGADGSWHAFPLLPDPPEKPFSERTFVVLPDAVDRTNFLPDHGFGVVNTKGCKGCMDIHPGQDACSLSRLSSGWEAICVMDGHGLEGDWPARRAARTIPWTLQSSHGCATMLRHGQVSAALHHAYDKVQADLAHESICMDVDLQIAGCTAICILHHEQYDSLWVANCGDSRVLLITPGRGAVASTIDHKFYLAGEVERIEALGCEVIRTVHEDGFVEERANIKGQGYPGLCMSRSLGDLCLKSRGVIHDPDVCQWDLSICGKERCFVLAASDGVWENITSEDAASLVLAELERGATCQAAAQALLRKARDRWQEETGGDYCDDITVVLAPVVRKPRRRGRLDFACDCCSAGPSKLFARWRRRR